MATNNSVNNKVITTAGVGSPPTSSSTQTITHNLGRIPSVIRVWSISRFVNSTSSTTPAMGFGLYNSTGNTCVYLPSDNTSATNPSTSTSFAVFASTSAGGSNSTGVIQNVTSTQFDIVWTVGVDSSTAKYMWEAS